MSLFGRKKKTDTEPITTLITFGSWQGEPIVWRILRNEGNRMYLFSEYVIDGMPFNKEAFQGNEFEHSDIHWWLNSPFRYDAFSEKEERRIIGEVSLLSLEDYKIIPYRIGKVTEYARSKDLACSFMTGGDGEEGIFSPDAAMWWLRDPAPNRQDAALIIGYDGVLFTDGMGVIMPHGGIRPAMWIKSFDISDYDNKYVRITLNDGSSHEGFCTYDNAEYCEVEFGGDEDALEIGDDLFYYSTIKKVELLNEMQGEDNV